MEKTSLLFFYRPFYVYDCNVGNYFMLGGGLKGGHILGEYPDNLTMDGPLNIGRGRFIPTTSWDEVLAPVAKWIGVAEEDLDHVLPNNRKFSVYEQSEIFE